MNEISILFNYIINQFKSDELVNTVSIVPTLEIDYNKENIYPLVNIDIQTTDIQDAIIVGSFLITIVQQRDVRPTVIDSKLLDTTNFIDNINECNAIAERFINVLTKQNNTDNIELESSTTLKVLKNWSRNSLDGVQFTIDLSTLNIGSSC